MGKAAASQATVRVQVKFLGDLLAVTGRRSLQVELPVGSTVRDLLASLSQTYGEDFRARIFNGPEKLHHTMLIFAGGVDIKRCGGLSARLERGDDEVVVEVIMLPMFGGG